MGKKENYDYFDEFVKTSDFIVESAKMLEATVNNYTKEALEENMQKVHGLENEADKSLHNMRAYLIKDFLPPIDREDIILIGHKLDDIEDKIDEILINFNILDIKQMKDEAKEFTELIIKSCENVKEVLKDFKNFKKFDLLKEKIILINRLEEQGDKLFEKAMKNLYTNSNDAIEIIKWTTIFNCFEDTQDACEHIADSIEDVIMKNS